MVQAIPEGFHTVTPTLTFKDCRKAIEFYETAFHAKSLHIFPTLDGKGIMHGRIQIGSSIIMMGDEMEGDNCAQSAETLGKSPIGFFLYVSDVDSVFEKAVAAGAQITMPVADMFWGDRAGQVKDPFGYLWMIATHTKDLTDGEIRENAADFFSSFTK
ncbi:Predicted enzyme related to lactoylglutathione lyase [Legionella wadsworthii]|uniref:Predicted enzyme related to lactoylglutathione lyase n=1 Tax=Legionella wadsworthii TaxID=28088 RepID=A0A378LVH1_9GAMM|nr:VOC family protein [Legionella wadsworthii]STY28091.1 Predicted enzyme related to lactoylglutathione lyase [Legionella wadsworthii]